MRIVDSMDAPPLRCPAWCTLTSSPLHGWELQGGYGRVWECWHAGPTFGPHVSCDGMELEDGSLSVVVSVAAEDVCDVVELEILASDVRAAARWMRSVAA